MSLAVDAGFEKHYPPLLGDEVWRLERIGKNGAYYQALSDSGIDTVQKLLQSYMKDEHKLLQVKVIRNCLLRNITCGFCGLTEDLWVSSLSVEFQQDVKGGLESHHRTCHDVRSRRCSPLV